jgi:hypothetical protein
MLSMAAPADRIDSSDEHAARTPGWLHHKPSDFSHHNASISSEMQLQQSKFARMENKREMMFRFEMQECKARYFVCGTKAHARIQPTFLEDRPPASIEILLL